MGEAAFFRLSGGEGETRFSTVRVRAVFVIERRERENVKLECV